MCADCCVLSTATVRSSLWGAVYSSAEFHVTWIRIFTFCGYARHDRMCPLRCGHALYRVLSELTLRLTAPSTRLPYLIIRMSPSEAAKWSAAAAVASMCEWRAIWLWAAQCTRKSSLTLPRYCAAFEARCSSRRLISAIAL